MKKDENLEVISLERAWSNFSQNKYARWPVREKVKPDSNRIEPFPDVSIDIPKINGTDKIMTLGSCFAKNLLKYISFFNVHSLNQKYLDSCDKEDIRWTNIYNPQVFLEFIHMAKELYSNGELSERSKNLGLVQVENGCFDLMFTIERDLQAMEKEKIQQKRHRFLKNLITKVFEADVLILTLGLVECWYDNLYQGYINVAPKFDYCKHEKERFEFRVLGYNQIVNALNELKEIIATTTVGTPKFIFTVSPVPLLATFRRQDVIVANVYSKSLLRACVEQVVIEDENAYYFPSYEMIFQSNSDVWTNDLRHVKPHIIVRIVNRFVNGALHQEHFPETKFNSFVLYALTQLVSKTEDFPTNNIREFYIGSYSLYPDTLSEEMLEVLRNQINQEGNQIVKKSKAYLFASLIIAMEDKNTAKASRYYSQLVRYHKLNQIFERSLLAGYGLLLNKPDHVLKVLQPVHKNKHEIWIVLYHIALAYAKKKDFAKAIYEVNKGLKNKNILQWVFIDHRAQNFLEYMCTLAKLQKDEESLNAYRFIIESSDWS